MKTMNGVVDVVDDCEDVREMAENAMEWWRIEMVQGWQNAKQLYVKT